MKVLDIVAKLRAEGHQVEYYTRHDLIFGREKKSSYRITKIDGTLFSKTGSKGNLAARRIIGKPQSKKVFAQTKRARAKISKKLSPAQYKKLERIHKTLIELAKKNKTKAPKKFSKVLLRKRVKYYGWKETIRAMKSSVRHHRGFVYKGYAEWAAEYIKTEMPASADFITRNWKYLTDEAVYKVTQLHYQIGKITEEAADSRGYFILEKDYQTNKTDYSSGD